MVWATAGHRLAARDSNARGSRYTSDRDTHARPEHTMPEDRSVLTRPVTPPDEVTAYGDGSDQVADLRYGGQTASSRPLLLILHGGYWRPGYDRAHTGPMAQALACAGWTVAAAEYRRIPGNPDAMLEDVRMAFEVLPDAVPGHDGRVVAIGHSAGGHLALWAATALRPASLRGVLGLAPVANLELADRESLGDGAVRAFLGTSPERRPNLDPSQLETPEVAVEILHGLDDSVVPPRVSESYVETHPQSRLESIAGCGHFQLIDPLSTVWPQVLAALHRLSGAAN